MNDILLKIEEGTIVKIKGKEYTIKSKVCYYTELEPEDYYFKIKCTDGTPLVISEDLTFICIGKNIELPDVPFTEIEEIEYEGEKYLTSGADYQFVSYVEFGNFGEYETECKFIDYFNKEETKLISLGLISSSNERDDVYLEMLEAEDIEIKD